MAGEAAARGWPVVPTTNLVRDLPGNLTAIEDAIAKDVGELALVTAATGIAAAAGWTVTTVNGFHVGRLKILALTMTRSGAAIGPASAGGNLTDTLVATLSGIWAVDGAMGMSIPVSWQDGAAGTSGMAVLSNAGALTVTDAHPTSSIGTGDAVRFLCMYRGAA